MEMQPHRTQTTRPKNTTRILLACVAVYAVTSLIAVWCAVKPLSITATQNIASIGFDGVESTPDGATTFRWAGADATLTSASPRSGWSIAHLTVIAADPQAILMLGQANQPLATFAVQSDTFRRYQTLVRLPHASADRQSYTFHTTPSLPRDGRTLGIALASFRIQPTLSLIPGAPPLSWHVAVLLSAVVLAVCANRGHWSLRTVGLACLGCAAPWILALAGIVPVHTASLAAGAALIGMVAALRAARSGMPRVVATERWLRRQWATQRGWGSFFLWLCLVVTVLIISRLWPVYASHGIWGSAGFVACLAVSPIILALRSRRIHLPIWGVAVLAGLATVALLSVYWVIYQRQIDGALMSDLPFHMDDARRLMLGKALVRYTVWVDGQAEVTTHYGNRWVSIPHPWFHWSIGAIAWLMRDPYYHRALPVTLMLYQLASMVILAFVMRSITGSRIHWVWIWLVSLLISVAAAVYLPDINPMIYRGQGSITIFHNATTIVAKPLTWMALLTAIALFSPRPRARQWVIVPLAIGCMMAATIAKPNGPLALLPALWGVVALRWLWGTRIPPRTGWLLVPSLAAVAVLLFQSTVRSNGGSDFGMSWMTAAALSSPAPFVSVIQLIAFPVLAAILSPILWRHQVVQTAVLAFVIAVVQYFVFIEPANVSANNFAWGMRIVVPLLYAAGLGIVLRDMRTVQPPSLRLHVLGLVLTAHLLSGVLYLLQLLTTVSYL
jgi:hypothetical protein